MTPAPLILCADDYALAPGVSRAILELIGRGRLSATSCMTLCPSWPEHAGWLKPLAGRADVGLHFTLTGGHRPLGPMPRLAADGRLPGLGAVMATALTRRLDAAEIRAELERQIDAFENHFGAPPAYIDGHQHVHLLPTVRDAVVAALTTGRLAGRGAWLRLCDDPAPAVLRRGVAVPKALLIATLGGPLRRLARRHGIPANDSFRGIYDLSGRHPFDGLMARFLAAPRGRTLVMCHPGHVDDALRAVDPVTDQRQREFDLLSGPGFDRLLETAGVRLARFSAT